ncbi:Uma2 family endonuclease, partial [bacterium]|nr:Uma2 family endonuclease [bacterium]
MLAEKKIFFTEQEYLEQEELSEEKHEFYKGEIFAMSGGTVNHSLISANITSEFRKILKDKSCKVFDSNLRIRVNSNGLYTYPDASVVCGKPELAGNRSDTITNPVLIVE